MPATWFITGTSSGFGRLLAEQLLARGDRVAATLRRPEALKDLHAEHGDRLWLARLDVTDTEQVHRVVTDAFEALGTIDVVISNAGYGVFASVEEADDEQIRRVIDTNLLGSIHVIRAALPHLRSQGHGRILQVSSAGGQATYPNFSYYHASKWGIEGFCETVAREVAPFGIGLTIVEPGATPTGFGGALDTAPAIMTRRRSRGRSSTSSIPARRRCASPSGPTLTTTCGQRSPPGSPSTRRITMSRSPS
jgi:NAD(P)-dependent dehydrogenase (short-subunit alcohol dehydrogenase family)